MKQTLLPMRVAKAVSFLLLGAAAFFAPSLDLGAQGKAKEAKKQEKAIDQAPAPELLDGTKPRNLVREGYTRPGKPETKKGAQGAIVPLVQWQAKYTGKIIGGTVYFAVYERTGTEGDPWGTGMANLEGNFVEGKSFNNTFSPALDTKARFLYLYQVVNDRGLDLGKPDRNKKAIAPALGQELNVEDVASATVRLLVDPRFITSWGHFRNAGFTLRVPDRVLTGQTVQEAGLAKEENLIRMAVSANPSIEVALPYRAFTDRSPAYPLGNLRNSLKVNVSNLNLTKSAAFDQLAKRRKGGKGIAMAAWEKQAMAAAEEGGKEPAFVQLLYPASRPDGAPQVVEEDGVVFPAAFRADWQDENVLKLGYQSTVFGFTTDLPPTDEMVRIADPVASRKGDGLVAPGAAPAVGPGGVAPAVGPGGVAPAVGPAQAVGTALGMATGTVPTPVPPAAAPAVGGGSGVGSFGMPIAGGTGFPGGAGIGGIGFARPGLGGGGGGLAGGTGGGAGTPTTGTTTGATTGTTTNTGQSSGNQNQTQTPTQGQTITVNPTFSNVNNQSQSQSQTQSQQQQQQQQQQQSQTQTSTAGAVVPEPGAIILALLGLPALLLLRRRKSAPAPTV
jgi:hypothetical protein